MSEKTQIEAPMTASARLLWMAAEVDKLKATSKELLEHDAPMRPDIGAPQASVEDDFNDIFGEDDQANGLRTSFN